MHPVRRQRLLIVVFIVLGASLATGLVVYALRGDMNLFYSPSQIVSGDAPVGHKIRAGGMVKKGSVVRNKKTLQVQFVITDFKHDVPVTYTGILPDLFGEGQGVVAMGRMGPGGQFVATQILAKHDEKYMPPEVADALKTARASGSGKPVRGGS